MKRYAWYLLLLLLVLTVCKSSPAVVEEASIVTASGKEGTASDSLPVSKELYDHTLAEVRLFVDNLNRVIQNKDYAGWIDALSDEFFARISSPEFLAKASESVLLRARKIVLKTPNDYFLYVVVPSRSNSKADEIEFISMNAVKVFYLEGVKNNNVAEIRRLRLYELIKKYGDTWKIID